MKIEAREIIELASDADIIDGLARRGAVTRRLADGSLKITLKVKNATPRQGRPLTLRTMHDTNIHPDAMIDID